MRNLSKILLKGFTTLSRTFLVFASPLPLSNLSSFPALLWFSPAFLSLSKMPLKNLFWSRRVLKIESTVLRIALTFFSRLSTGFFLFFFSVSTSLSSWKDWGINCPTPGNILDVGSVVGGPGGSTGGVPPKPVSVPLVALFVTLYLFSGALFSFLSLINSSFTLWRSPESTLDLSSSVVTVLPAWYLTKNSFRRVCNSSFVKSSAKPNPSILDTVESITSSSSTTPPTAYDLKDSIMPPPDAACTSASLGLFESSPPNLLLRFKK